MSRAIRYFLLGLSGVLAVAALSGLILYKTAGLRLYSVQSGSMAPAMLIGDLAIDLKAPSSLLKPGDVISYVSSNGSGEIVTHRIVNIDNNKGVVITRGDNLAQADPPVPANAVIGRTVKTVPAAGYLLDQLHKPLLLISLVYIPGLVIAAAEIRRLGCHYGRRPYQADTLRPKIG
jgi:signal peptidase